jgi:hypothetical protein
MRNIFSFTPNTDKKDTSEINRVANMARMCMGMKEFKEYQSRYAVLEHDITESLIADATNFSLDQSDMAKFGAKCLVKLNRLRDVRSLLVNVVVDEKRDAGV